MAESVIGTIAVAIKAKNDALLNGLKQANTEIKTFSTNFAKDFGAIAAVGAAAFAAVAVAVKASVDAAAEAETSQNDLAQAFRNAGEGSGRAMQDALALSTQLQRLTGFSDELINSTQQELVQFGLLGENLKKATQSTLDLAVAKKISLTQAAELVGKAFIGETGRLKQYGIVIDQSLPKSEQFADVLNKINNTMGGAAAARANTYAGQMMILKENFSDLAEALGVLFLPALTKVVKMMNTAAQETVDFIEKVGGLKNALMLAGAQAAKMSLEQLPLVGAMFRMNRDGIDQYIAKLQQQMVAEKLQADQKKMLDMSVATAKIQTETMRVNQLMALEQFETNARIVRRGEEAKFITETEAQMAKDISRIQTEREKEKRKMEMEEMKAQTEHRAALNKVYAESEQFMTSVFSENLTSREKAQAAFRQALKLIQDAIVKSYIENSVKQQAVARTSGIAEASAAKPAIAANFFKAHSMLPFVGQAIAIGLITASFAFIDRLIKFNKGGVVPGSGNGDTVPALLTPGERVLTKAENRAYEAGAGGGGGNTFIINGMLIEGNENAWRELFNSKLLPIMERSTAVKGQGILNRRRGARS